MTLEPYERNLFDFVRAIDGPLVQARFEDDVIWCTSTIPVPQFSGVLNAQFRRDVVRRTHQVLDRLIGHGRPFVWWLTAGSTSPELEATLVERGLVAREPTTAMRVDLREAAEAMTATRSPGVTLEPGTNDNAADLFGALVDGFGMPPELRDTLATLLGSLTDRQPALHNVLARHDGVPVGAGSVLVSDGVAGLYNIAVTEAARGRGIGRDVTAYLMRLGRTLGCTESILHATAMGEPVYARLGYRPVGTVRQYEWNPEDATGAERLA